MGDACGTSRRPCGRRRGAPRLADEIFTREPGGRQANHRRGGGVTGRALHVRLVLENAPRIKRDKLNYPQPQGTRPCPAQLPGTPEPPAAHDLIGINSIALLAVCARIFVLPENGIVIPQRASPVRHTLTFVFEDVEPGLTAPARARLPAVAGELQALDPRDKAARTRGTRDKYASLPHGSPLRACALPAMRRRP